MTQAKRTLTVQTERGETVHCNVVRIERSAEPGSWIVIVDAFAWLPH